MDYIKMGLDPLVIPMVEYFNANGLETVMSCQGHNKTNLSMFWIQFADCITSNDIQEFMKRHLNQYGVFCSCGRFAKRMYGCYNVITQKWNTIESWYYLAATADAADADLKCWNDMSNKWQGFNAEPYVSWRNETLKRSFKYFAEHAYQHHPRKVAVFKTEQERDTWINTPDWFASSLPYDVLTDSDICRTIISSVEVDSLLNKADNKYQIETDAYGIKWLVIDV